LLFALFHAKGTGLKAQGFSFEFEASAFFRITVLVLDFCGTIFFVQTCHCSALSAATARFSLFLPVVPVMTRTEAVKIWCGLRPCSPVGLPYIGRPWAYDNLIISTATV
jgi:hypothetical protein